MNDASEVVRASILIVDDDDAFLLASNEIQSLRDSLWRATRDKFAAADNEVLFGKFTR